MELDIAAGRYRNTKVWANKKYTWAWIVNKIRDTHRTDETFEEYLSLPNDTKDTIKAMPGAFFGGYLTDGARHNHTVKLRQLVTLDLDFATMDAWEYFEMVYSCAGALYSTHKHCSDAARFRILIPLSRPVTNEEYEPIARRIANNIGMKMFDATTFQVARFMYWPSTAKDGEYVFESQEGNYLDPDKVLESYTDWRDISSWPLCKNENDKIRTEVAEQKNPLEKKGLIGAFNRAYSISEAIATFIPDQYTEGGDGRYSYKHGSTSGGAIVYDDMFMYSWHNSDPAGSQLVNSFDLIRLHKFAHLDKGSKSETLKLESYKEMTEFARRDFGVLSELATFDGAPLTGAWVNEMEATATGVFRNTINNVLLVLRNDPELKGAFAFNQFENQIFVTTSVPWNQADYVRPCEDADDAGLRHYLERRYHIFQANKTRDALEICAIENAYHPVREYIESLNKWDGIPRLDSLLIDSLGAPDTEYVRAVTRKTLVAAIKRIKHPGCKFDYVLITVGDQGLRKSTLWDELGGAFFSDSFTTMQGKEAYEQLQGAWLIEWAELAALKRTDQEPAKHFITKRVDRYRVAYGRRTANFPRQCIFLGSTNEWSFLKDPTGSRRYWPVAITVQYEDGSANIEQIWAEALHYYNQGEKVYLSKDLELEARKVQSVHYDTDERLGLVEKYLDTLIPSVEQWEGLSRQERRSYWRGTMPFGNDLIGKRMRDKVCVAEIWCEALDGDFKEMGTNNTKFIHAMMQNLKGWEQGKPNRFGMYGLQRAYVRVQETTVKIAEELKEYDYLN